MCDFDEADLPRPDPPSPGRAKTAGILWIIFGGLTLLFALLLVLIFVVFTNHQGGMSVVSFGRSAYITILFGLIGGVLFLRGIQTVTRRARDTLGSGIGSILLASLMFLVVDLNRIDSLSDMALVSTICIFVVGGAFLTAGIFALVDRNSYQVWRDARNRAR